MSKQLTPAELASIVTNLLVNPQQVGELDSPERYGAFMTDVASLICDHCGGEVSSSADDWVGEWLVGIISNDSLPDDGGIWKDFDPEGELFNAQNPEVRPCPSLHAVPEWQKRYEPLTDSY